jgi:hypothetical protein
MCKKKDVNIVVVEPQQTRKKGSEKRGLGVHNTLQYFIDSKL